jgi:hypothetical protein
MTSQDPDIAAILQQILNNQQTFQNDINTMASDINTLRSRVPPPGFSVSQNATSGLHQITNTSIKLDIPRFDGTEPMSWIFKINQFFDFHQTVEDQRLRIASFYMEGEALTWYQWMHDNGQLTSWPRFLHALELRFAPSQFDDPRGALFKLCQTTTVQAYQAEFEALANRIVGLPHQFYLSCFISGLKPNIRREVQAFQPLSLTHAISLAKLQEDKFTDRFNPIYKKPESSINPNRTTPLPRPALTTNQASPKPPTRPTPPIRRLTPAELQARREQNLCYNCDETYHSGHCRRQFLLLIVH